MHIVARHSVFIFHIYIFPHKARTNNHCFSYAYFTPLVERIAQKLWKNTTLVVFVPACNDFVCGALQVCRCVHMFHLFPPSQTELIEWEKHCSYVSGSPASIWGPSCWRQVQRSIHKNTWGPCGTETKSKSTERFRKENKKEKLSYLEKIGESSELFNFLNLVIYKNVSFRSSQRIPHADCRCIVQLFILGYLT